MSDNRIEIQIQHSLQTALGTMPMEVALSLKQGIINVLTGPSGAGKTTLLRQIAGLLTPHSGKISFGQTSWLDTENKSNLPPQQRNIGFVFQDYALFPNMTVRENLLFALPKSGDTQIVNELLTATDLSQLQNRRPNQLSGGQQQRVALARALVRKPDLLLLDEPFNALDAQLRYQLQNLLLKFHAQFGFSVIMVTHNLGEIFRLADQVILMENGRVAKQGTPPEVYAGQAAPVHSYTVFGEVLNIIKTGEGKFAEVLIDQKIRKIRIPAKMENTISIGQKFTLNQNLDFSAMQWFSPGSFIE